MSAQPFGSPIRKEIGYCLLSGFIGLIGAMYFLGLYDVDLRVPFMYERDAMGGLIAARNIISGNGWVEYPNMGAPGIVTRVYSPDTAHLLYFGMWVLSFFINEPGLLTNIFYILTFFTVAASAALSLRLLKISPIVSVAGGVIFTLLHYHYFRGTRHILLSAYAIVPIACVVILWIMNGELELFKNISGSKGLLSKIFNRTNAKFLFSICVALITGLINIYYTFFICLCICFAMLWNLLEERNVKKIKAPIIVLLTIVFVKVIAMIPFIVNILSGNAHVLSVARGLHDVELQSFRIVHLILPVWEHRIPFFAWVRKIYEYDIQMLARDSRGSALGILLSIGFIASFFIAMLKRKTNNPESAAVLESSVRNSAVHNMFLLIVGTAGGLSSIFIAFMQHARAYNRLSVFIAFFSLLIVCYYGDRFFKRKKYSKMVTVLVISCITVLASFDMAGNSNIGRHYEQEYHVRKQFFSAVEDKTPAGSMVFQLPFVPSNHMHEFNDIPRHVHNVPFVNTESLRWSYRAMYGSAAERWQEHVAGLPTDKMLEQIAANGFSGVYIDIRGYVDDEAHIIIEEISEITGSEYIICGQGFMVYFYIGEFTDRVNSELTEQERELYRWDSMFS